MFTSWGGREVPHSMRVSVTSATGCWAIEGKTQSETDAAATIRRMRMRTSVGGSGDVIRCARKPRPARPASGRRTLLADAALLVPLAAGLRAALLAITLLAGALPALLLLVRALDVVLEALVALPFLLLVIRSALLPLFVRHGFTP